MLGTEAPTVLADAYLRFLGSRAPLPSSDGPAPRLFEIASTDSNVRVFRCDLAPITSPPSVRVRLG